MVCPLKSKDDPPITGCPLQRLRFPATKGLTLVLKPWLDSPQIGGGDSPHTGAALLDIDDDRDIDLVLSADGQAPITLINDRLGAFRASPLADLGSANINGLLAADLDKDGHVDLVVVEEGGKVAAWKNVTERSPGGAKLAFRTLPCDAKAWRSAVANDIDLDTWTDLVGLPSVTKTTTLSWARNAATKFVPQELAIAPDGEAPTLGFALANLVGGRLARRAHAS